MDLQPIGVISKRLNVSVRTIRYYEQIGLIKSARKGDGAYRYFDGDAARRLRQIIVLRKLRIPLKQISEILRGDDISSAINYFEQNLSELGDEITALSTIKSILESFVARLNRAALVSVQLGLLDDESLLEIVDSLTISKINFKEEKNMDDLNQAAEKINKLADKDVRIIYLPPSEIAAYQFEGDEPERHVGRVIDKFVLDNDLINIKPDLRHYGFNAPNPDESDPAQAHGYEMWVTVPDGFSVPAPLEKKRFCGGIYAAHMIPFGAFEEWGWLMGWVMDNAKYEFNGDWGNANQWGCLEESLNYVNRVRMPDSEGDGFQLDLLVPVREKNG